MSAERSTGLPSIDEDAIRSHVEMLHSLAAPLAGSKLVAGFFGEDPNGTDPKTGKPGLRLTPVVSHSAIGDAETTVRTIVNIAARSHINAYMALAVFRPELRSGGKGYEKDIVGMLGICADFDDADATRWAERLPQAPNYVIESSAGRYQCFYLFDRPEPYETVKPVAERLKHFSRCDHGTSDMCHVWRVPGCPNWPNAKKIAEGRSPEPQLARIVLPWQGDLTSLADLAAALPEAEPGNSIAGEDPQAEAPQTDDAATDDTVSIELLVRQLPPRLQAKITEPGAGDRSKDLFKIIKDLGGRGFDARMIERIIRVHPGGIGAKYVDRHDLGVEIERVLAKTDNSYSGSDSSWRNKLITNEEGAPRICVANAITALRHAPEWQGLLAFDVFRRRTVICGRPPWLAAADWAPPCAAVEQSEQDWTQTDDTRLADWLQHQGIIVTPVVAGQAVETVAHDHEFHPIKDYLSSLA